MLRSVKLNFIRHLVCIWLWSFWLWSWLWCSDNDVVLTTERKDGRHLPLPRLPLQCPPTIWSSRSYHRDGVMMILMMIMLTIIMIMIMMMIFYSQDCPCSVRPYGVADHIIVMLWWYIYYDEVCVCLSQKSHHFPLLSWALEAQTERAARPCRPWAGFCLVILMMIMVTIMMMIIMWTLIWMDG